MLAWVNDEIIGRRTAAEKKEEDHKDDDSGSTGNGVQEENKGGESEEENQGTLILDATCASQNILTLITCDRSYGGATGRLLVMAVQQ